jgi:hypothetical protein
MTNTNRQVTRTGRDARSFHRTPKTSVTLADIERVGFRCVGSILEGKAWLASGQAQTVASMYFALYGRGGELSGDQQMEARRKAAEVKGRDESIRRIATAVCREEL